MLQKRLAALLIVTTTGVIALSGGASARQPVASASKYCSAYAEEHFHGKNVRTPGGVKCLEVGEYCSHGPGYASAYRKAGFLCNAEGRLERR